MPTFQVTDPNSGLSVQLTGDSPPSEQELEDIFAQLSPGETQQVQPTPQIQDVEPQNLGANPRARRAQRGVQKREVAKSEVESNLARLESGEITARDLTEDQIAAVQEARRGRLPELSEVSVQGLADSSAGKGLAVGAAALTALNPVELGNILTSQFPQIGISTSPPTPENPQGIQVAVNNDTGATVVINKPGISSIDILQGLGLVAAFTPAGRAASAAPAGAASLIGRPVASKLGIGALAQGVGAGATETVIQGLQAAAGGEFNEEEIALAAALGGGAELVGPAARASLEKARQVLRQGGETAEQAARRELIEQTIGVQPTRAQVTQSPKDFQVQQEIAKGGGPVRSALDAQEQAIGETLEAAAERTGGRVATSESTPVNEILNRSLLLDDQISGLYKEARAAAPTTKNITLKKLSSVINRNKGFETKSAGVLSAVRSILKDKGVTLKKPKTVTEARRQDVTVAMAEDVRQQLNAMFPDSNATGKKIIRELKDALDDDVFRQTGGDSFKTARAAKREFEQDLERAGVSKFDSRKANIVRDLLENKITPDQLVDKISTSKTVRNEDVRQLKNYLNQTESGVKAWNDIRAQVIDGIRSKMFNEKGELIQGQFARSMDALGGKSKELFTPDERVALGRLREAIKLRIPTKSETLGLGPSGQVARVVKARLPLIGPIIDGLGEFRLNRLLLRLPKRLKESKPIDDIQVPVATAQTLKQDTQ